MKRIHTIAAAIGIALTTLSAPSAFAGELTGNAGVTNNYIWRGLTQTENSAAVSGGLDFAADNGFYIGTWISNVSYAPADIYSYENDIYFGFSSETDNGFSWDVGYLYYNYDEEANFDFGELYGSISYGGFSFAVNVLANTEADEGPGQDFSFGDTTYMSANYAFEVREGVELAFHVGSHDGDFSEAFNGVTEGYIDYGVSVSKDGLSVGVTGTDLDDAGPEGLDNDAIKFVVSYAVDFAL